MRVTSILEFMFVLKIIKVVISCNTGSETECDGCKWSENTEKICENCKDKFLMQEKIQMVMWFAVKIHAINESSNCNKCFSGY